MNLLTNVIIPVPVISTVSSPQLTEKVKVIKLYSRIANERYQAQKR